MRLLALLLALVLAACATAPEPLRPLEGRRILVFSHTTGYRHASIEVARPALARLIAEAGGTAVLSEDPTQFDSDGLAGFDAIVLLSNTTLRREPATEWLTGARRTNLQAFVRRGGGIVGIHAATDSHYHWPWYGDLLGSRFQRHPPGTPRGRLSVPDRGHPATTHLPETLEHTDEWYMIEDRQPGSRLLLTLDPASIGESGEAAPISWAREFGGGRVFYTALGHTAETYSEPFFLGHVRGGLAWVLERR